MAALKIVYKDPGQLNPRAKNPRTHTRRQIRQIAASITEFGFINPILVDGADGIIAGHGRVEAAKLLGMSDVPTLRVDHLTPAQVRAYVIADNKLAENAGWDRALLALELQELSVHLDFDVTITGFETAEIDLLIRDLDGDSPDDADEVPEIDRAAPAVSRPGDLWLIGDHRLLCGDSLNTDSYIALLGGQTAQMVFTDPPYNVVIDGHVSGLGKVKHREFAMASGEMSTQEFTRFLKTVLMRLAEFSSDGSLHFICMDWRHMRELLVMHPTVKPVAMVGDAILDCSKRESIVLDAFAGSGTTLIAAEKTGRRGYGIELDCHYTDTITRRFEEIFGLKAVHAESELNFEQLKTKRSTEAGHGRNAKAS
jgi:16S rRNA G966 N2-methylase RsmD